MDSTKQITVTLAEIQALENGSSNPLNGEAWPQGHRAILEGRRKLPVYERADEILGVLNQHQVFILTSGTGSGKSTQIPQFLVYREHLKKSGLKVACTQPRRLAASELGKRLSTEMGVVLGEEVGYRIGGEKVYNSKKTRLLFLTEGVLLGLLALDKDLSEYGCIIIDEAHERTVQTDLLMGLLKEVLRRRQDLKLIVMSATMDAESFQKYFNDCPLIQIPGRSFEVAVMYIGPEDASSDMIAMSANFILHIHKNSEPGNILVFLPGVSEIDRVHQMIRPHSKGLDVFNLYSTMPRSEQSQALNYSSSNRKCILATNIAETSLTIENVGYVVDAGFSKQMIYNPRLAMNMLLNRQISQASANQRKGRAGRTRDGVCYRLYSEEDYQNMPASTSPAVRTSPVHSAILRLLIAGYKKVTDFEWLEAPPPEAVARAGQDLLNWGFINDQGRPTRSGKLAARCPLEPIWFHAIEIGVKLGCAMIIVDIAVLCSTSKSILTCIPGYEQVAQSSRQFIASYPSDHLTLIHAFDMYLHVREKHEENPTFSLRNWCKVHFMDYAALEEAREARAALKPFLQKTAKFPPTRGSTKDNATVRKALAIALCTQAAVRHGGAPGAYQTVHEKVLAIVEPNSSALDGDYEWVVYNDLVMSGGKIRMQTVTAIDAEWLVDLPYFQNLPLTVNGLPRQENVKISLDEARARIEASKAV